MADNMDYIFISYCKEDAELMRRVRSTLEQNNLKTWTDEQLPPDVPNRKQAIHDAMEAAEAVLVILSPDAKASPQVNSETQYALVHNIDMYSVLARGSKNTALLPELDSWDMIDISDARKYETGMQKLIQNLKVREQFWLLAESIPTSYVIGVNDVDGLGIATYVPKSGRDFRNSGEEDSISPIGAIMIGLGGRVVRIIRAGSFRLGILQGDKGTIFSVVIGQYLITIGVREVKSIDTILAVLPQRLPQLLAALEVSTPELKSRRRD